MRVMVDSLSFIKGTLLEFSFLQSATKMQISGRECQRYKCQLDLGQEDFLDLRLTVI